METTRDSREERLNNIGYWWDLASAPGLYVDSKLHQRLYASFTKVLLAMSQEEFAVFEQKQIHLICDLNPGRAYQFYKPLSTKFRADHIAVNVIYIAPWATRWKEQKLQDTVAHETAHHILNHPQCHGGSPEWETEADDLAVKWGFKRSYSKAMLKKLSSYR